MTSRGLVDPFGEMDRMWNAFGGRWRGGIMPTDAFERGGVYTLRFDLPGVDPDDVDVTVEGNVLTVTADRQEEETGDVTWLLRERPSGTHRRELRLGERLDTRNITASHDNGVLTVTIPMRDEAKPHKVSVASGSTDKITGGGS